MATTVAINVRCSRCRCEWVRFTPDGYIPEAPLCGACEAAVEQQEADAQESSPVVSRATTIRLPLSFRERVARLAEKLSARAAGMPVRRFAVLRRALELGLAALEKEEGVESTYTSSCNGMPQTPTPGPVTTPSGVVNTPTSPKRTP